MTESSCRTHSSSIANSDWQTNRATAFNMQKHAILWHTKTWSSFTLTPITYKCFLKKSEGSTEISSVVKWQQNFGLQFIPQNVFRNLD